MPPLLLCTETGDVIREKDADSLAITMPMSANIYPVWMEGFYVGYISGSTMISKTVKYGRSQSIFDQETGTVRQSFKRDRANVKNYGDMTYVTSNTYPLYSDGYYIGYVKDGHIHRMQRMRQAKRNELNRQA